MKVIFLDIDGVLNSIKKLEKTYNKTLKPHSGYSYPFDEECLELLQFLVLLTKAKLVITSVWRKTEEGKETLLNALKPYGLDTEVIGYTPILGESREKEIKKFLENSKDITKYVILDDEWNMKELAIHLVKTNPQYGLTMENVCDAEIKLF